MATPKTIPIIKLKDGFHYKPFNKQQFPIANVPIDEWDHYVELRSRRIDLEQEERDFSKKIDSYFN